MAAAKNPRFTWASGAWSRMDVARAAPEASERVARVHAVSPPGCRAIMGTNHTATAATPATTVVTARATVRVAATTATSASSANASAVDCRKPVRMPSVTTAHSPWFDPGRARQANSNRAGQANRSNE